MKLCFKCRKNKAVRQIAYSANIMISLCTNCYEELLSAAQIKNEELQGGISEWKEM